VRSGLRLVPEAHRVEVVAEASDGREAVPSVPQSRPEVSLIDVRVPRLDGIAAIRQLTKVVERAKVLVLTTYDPDRYVYDALKAGATGFLLKATSPTGWSGASARIAAGSPCWRRR
jgi:DNA-binding NarL/FixJ family response regulator